jgi:ribosome-associated protein
LTYVFHAQKRKSGRQKYRTFAVLYYQNNITTLTTTTARRANKASAEQLNHAIVEGIRDKKGKKIVQLDLRHLGDAPADFFIICEGDSNTHVKAISDSIRKKVEEEMRQSPAHIEGSSNSKWVLMDYFNTVVHVFYPETREFYELENLWSDAGVTEFAEI